MASSLGTSDADSPPPCCPPRALPALQFDYKPQGEHFEIGVNSDSRKMKVYLAASSSITSNMGNWQNHGPLIIVCHDTFGPFSGMHRKIADELAAQTQGIVLVPDFLEGSGGLCPRYSDENDQPYQLGFNAFTFRLISGFLWSGMSFYRKYPWDTKHKPLFVNHLIPFLQSKGIEKFALLGFCYGSWISMKACNEEAVVKHVTCAVHYHPGIELLEKNVFGNKDGGVGLCRTCQRPQLIHSTKNESDDWKPDGAAHKLLLENDQVPEVQFSLAPQNQSHGFMTRADMRVETNRVAIKEGLNLGVAFLKKYNLAGTLDAGK